MDHIDLFAAASALITDLEAAYITARKLGIVSGRLTSSRGTASAELQWPWNGWDPRIGKGNDFVMRFVIEARQDQAEVKAPAAEPVEDEPADVEELPLDPSV